MGRLALTGVWVRNGCEVSCEHIATHEPGTTVQSGISDSCILFFSRQKNTLARAGNSNMKNPQH